MTTSEPSTPGAAGTRARSTRQFHAVAAELAESSDFRSAQDIHAAMRHDGRSIGLATVYRALQTLVDAGEADMVKTGSGEAVYRQCSTTHHHHLVCRQCGTTVEVQGAAFERWADKTADEYGFSDLSHTLELFGICATCRGQA
jgi:Fur family ferric uptake transcriptional regulator